MIYGFSLANEDHIKAKIVRYNRDIELRSIPDSEYSGMWHAVYESCYTRHWSKAEAVTSAEKHQGAVIRGDIHDNQMGIKC